jgi:outer membrane protein TolC
MVCPLPRLLAASAGSLLCFVAALPGAAPTWPAAPATLENLAAEGWRSNLALAGEAIELERAAARLEEARSHFLPRLDLAARYSRADGGRTIDFPTGDLLNGAYATLNQYLAAQGQPARFPTLTNQSIPLLRDREQETKLRLTQPIYAPAISRSVTAARAGLAAQEWQYAAYRRQLRAEIEEAVLRHRLAEAVLGIHDSALALVRESLRVNRSLVDNGKATEDQVLRAEAEVAAVEQQRQDAAKDRDLARSYVNFLLNRPLDTPLGSLPGGELDAWSQALAAAEPPVPSVGGREELQALARAEAAAHAGSEAVRARQLPTVALAVEGGIQGEAYRTGAGSNYALGSLVLEWNLFDGSQRHSEAAQARLDERQASRRRAEATHQLALQLQQASDEFTVARTGLEAAGSRRTAARESYRMVARRETEGMSSQLTVLDARNTLTSAELNYEITRTRLLVAAVRLDRAAALTPLP